MKVKSRPLDMSGIVTKRIVCLANSRKPGGRCVAGKELLVGGHTGAWVRPVSDRENEAVDDGERQYRDGSEPAVLDVIDVPLLKAKPKSHQQENWLLNPRLYWTRERRASVKEVHQLVDPIKELWDNGYSSRSGHNNRVPELVARELTYSLCLVEVSELTLHVYSVSSPYPDSVRRRMNGSFSYYGVDYCLRVTDPVCEDRFQAMGIHNLGECFLTVSLGEKFKDGYCYKLIAAVIKR